MKKILFFALALVAGVMSMNAQTALDTTQVDGIWYILDKTNHTSTVTFRPSDTDPNMVAEENYMGRLNIPSVLSVYNEETYNYDEYTVTAIGDSAFAKSPYLTAVTIPASVKTLGLYLMKDFNKNVYGGGIKELVISDGDEPIEFTYRQGDTGEEFSFSEAAMTCTYLYLGRNVTMKTDVDWDIPIFHTWGSIEEVVFGEGFTEVPVAFCPYSRNLWSIQINSRSLLEAGPRMFAFLDEDNPKPDAKGITLYVPYGMKNIYAADEYWSRFSIEEMDEAQRYGIKYADDYFDFFINGLYYKRTSRGVSVVIPQVWYINHDGSYVSQWSSEFPYKQSEITIPESITLYLKDYTTYSLTPKDGYEETTLTVAGIGDYCFRGARNLEQLTIPNTVAEVGMEAFEDALNLKSLDIPESVIHTGWLAFARAGFEEIVIPASCSKWEFNQGTAVFQECLNLRKVTFAKGTTRIPDRIFFGCTALRTVIIPDEVTEIGAGAFAGCSALSYLQLPTSLEKIYNRTFRGCPLRELEIPAGVQTIEESALLGTLLTKLTVNPNNKVFDSRDKCNAVIRTKDNTMVAACNGSFIPESVDSIGYEAFAELDGIRSLTLPKNLKHVAPQAFMNLNNLTLITSYIENPAGVLEEDAFNGWYANTHEQATLYVPVGTLAAYQADHEWAKFQHIVEMTVENKPASVEDIAPIAESGTTSLAGLATNADLTNAVVGNLYLTCDTTNGDHYDAAEQALVLNTVVDSVMIENVLANPDNMDVIRNNFSGIILTIPAGTGTLNLTIKTTGNREIAVLVEGSEAETFAQAVKGQINIPYSVENKAYVFIYGIVPDEPETPVSVPSKFRARAKRTEAAENSVSIYDVQWEVASTTTGIKDVHTDASSTPRKIMIDNIIYILRGGKIYTIQGLEVK
ncbi:MAG: leucine-rich repeat domain-containing protein [Paludibacteraceae bacterium]|nr:leucine-rich repeat domain-containing protein [Paludibacteraceae bacterium]